MLFENLNYYTLDIFNMFLFTVIGIKLQSFYYLHI